jgi:hypothetical protein
MDGEAMSIRGMRVGDSIFAKDASAVWIVEEVGFDKVEVYDRDRPSVKKTISSDDLECVDAEDGIWQEMES